MNKEEKNLVLDQAKLYLEGHSLREVAQMTNQSATTVRRNFLVKLSEDESLYKQVLQKMQENQPLSIKNPEITKRVLNACHLLLDQNMTVAEIAKALNATQMEIYRDLTKRIYDYHEIDPDAITEEMLDSISITLKNHSKNNSPFLNVDTTILEKMYPTEERRYHFIARCILNFKFTIDTACSIFKIEKNELDRKLEFHESKVSQSLNYHLFHSPFDQDSAKSEFITYFNKLKQAYLNRDIEAFKKQVQELNDSDAIKIKKEHEKNHRRSDEEILIILNYQLKYAISSTAIEKIFSIKRAMYKDRVEALADRYPLLVSNFHYLSDFFNYRNIELGSRR